MMLSALRLPGNIEGRLADLQARLFREHGLLSARALPPLVPLLWTQNPPELADVDPAPLPPLTVTEPEVGRAGVVLGLSPLAPLQDLARRLGEGAREPESSPPFALGAPAILLAPAPGTAVDPTSGGTADPAPGAATVYGTVVRSFTLVVIDIRVWEGEEPERVVWEEVAQRRLRKQRV